jgi:hypothetical protein
MKKKPIAVTTVLVVIMAGNGIMRLKFLAKFREDFRKDTQRNNYCKI